MMLILVPVVSLESPLNIDAKVSTCPAFGFCDVIMTCALTKIKKFYFLHKRIGKIGYWLKILQKTHFDRDFSQKYEKEW